MRLRSWPSLFARAADVPADELPGGTSDEVAEAMLTSLGRRLTDEPTASLAVLRSMLTNADADLRASLLSAIVPGVIAERYLLRPCFQSLTTPPPAR
jgi:hypothetical protein